MISDLCLPPLGGQAEAAVFAFLRTIFKKSEPDLVVFTGGLGEPTQQKERLKRFCAWMDECGIPWTFTFGDEDRSFFTPVRTLESTLLSSAACLYECGDLRVRGEGNYAVALQDPQRNTHWVLWMLDTGDAVVRTPFFHNVIDWCAQARAAVQEDCGMLCFCHRALPEFAAFAPATEPSRKLRFVCIAHGGCACTRHFCRADQSRRRMRRIGRHLLRIWCANRFTDLRLANHPSAERPRRSSDDGCTLCRRSRKESAVNTCSLPKKRLIFRQTAGSKFCSSPICIFPIAGTPVF